MSDFVASSGGTFLAFLVERAERIAEDVDACGLAHHRASHDHHTVPHDHGFLQSNIDLRTVPVLVISIT